MSAPTLPNGLWAASWSLNCNNELAGAVNPQRFSQRVSDALNARRCAPTILGNGAPNPQTVVAPIRLRSRSLVTLTCTFRVNHPSGSVSGAVLNRDVADAFKYATGPQGAGLGAERIAGAMGFCDDIGELFRWEPPLAVVCADYRQLREGETATYGVTSALGSTVAAAGTGPVASSDNPALIGRQLAPHNGSIFDDVGAWLSSVPTGYKVAGAAVLVIGGAVAVGYVRRSFR